MRVLGALAIFVAGMAVGAGSTVLFLALAPTSPFHPSPVVKRDPHLNFASGDFKTVADVNACRMQVKFTATSKADGTGATGTITMNVVPSSGCTGQAAGRITCLLVTGNHAVFSGWLDSTSGIFNIGNVVLATITQGDPQTYGPPVDRAGIGIAVGSPECPPAISGTGPAIISGSIQVAQATAVS